MSVSGQLYALTALRPAEEKPATHLE